MLSTSVKLQGDPTSRDFSYRNCGYDGNYQPYFSIVETHRLKREANHRPNSRGRLHEIKQQFTVPPSFDPESKRHTRSRSCPRTDRTVINTPVIRHFNSTKGNGMNESQHQTSAVGEQQQQNGTQSDVQQNDEVRKSPGNGTSRLQEINQQFTLRSGSCQDLSRTSKHAGEKVIVIRSDRPASRLQNAYQQYTPRVSRNTPLQSHPGYYHDYMFEESNTMYRNSGTTPQPRGRTAHFAVTPILREPVR